MSEYKRTIPSMSVMVLVAALGGVCFAQSPRTINDPVLDALEEVRHQRADLYDLESSNLGTLATALFLLLFAWSFDLSALWQTPGLILPRRPSPRSGSRCRPQACSRRPSES